MSPDHSSYATARRIAPGCQHEFACKCDTPYWLREPTAAELAFQQRFITPPQRLIESERDVSPA